MPPSDVSHHFGHYEDNTYFVLRIAYSVLRIAYCVLRHAYCVVYGVRGLPCQMLLLIYCANKSALAT